LSQLNPGIILSAQLEPSDPITDPCFIVSMAQAAKSAGVVAIRTNGREHVRIVREKVNLPVIGLVKNRKYKTFITPTFEDVREVILAGCNAVAIDCTRNERPVPLNELFKMIRMEFPHVEIVADIADRIDAEKVLSLEPDYIATTLSGYTEYTKDVSLPNIELVRELSEFSKIPIIAEGGYSSVDNIRDAFIAGAYAVVIGSALTRPWLVLSRFVEIFDELQGIRGERL